MAKTEALRTCERLVSDIEDRAEIRRFLNEAREQAELECSLRARLTLTQAYWAGKRV
jgi:hypothetical protein